MLKDDEALEALDNIKREAGTPYFSTLYDIDMWRDDFKTVTDALRERAALKFIFAKLKEHKTELCIDRTKSGRPYIMFQFQIIFITEEEAKIYEEILNA